MSISGGVHLVSSNHLHGTPVKKTNLPPLFSRDLLLKCKKSTLYFQPLLARFPLSLTCKSAGNSNNDTRNPDFSKKNYQRRENEGPPPPRGKFKNYQDRDDLLETTQLLSSKNGRSTTTNPLTAPTKSVSKDEILELFRRHLPQLRENRPVNSNNRSYGPQATLQKRGEEEREAFDSLLKLLKSYGPDHGRRPPSNNSNDTKATINNGENINGASDFEDEVPEPFDPVPVVKHEPIVPSKTHGGETQMLREEEEKSGTVSVFYEAESEGPQSEEEKMLNLGALKLSELREIAKSRGLKGYTKLKKAELLEQLSAN